MARPSKAQDLRRLEEIADEFDKTEALLTERAVIWKRRAEARDCAETSDARDKGLSVLARHSRVQRAQVSKALLSGRASKGKPNAV